MTSSAQPSECLDRVGNCPRSSGYRRAPLLVILSCWGLALSLAMAPARDAHAQPNDEVRSETAAPANDLERQSATVPRRVRAPAKPTKATDD
ncbi:MAG TPA: hypothetical protein VIV60_34250, partial [Polyangiaceae bacterium]